jgi:hypothetical protein
VWQHASEVRLMLWILYCGVWAFIAATEADKAGDRTVFVLGVIVCVSAFVALLIRVFEARS